MAMNADTLLDRINLKNQVRRWRVLAFVAMALLVSILGYRFSSFSGGDAKFIARVNIEGFIGDDVAREKMFAELANDKKVKAVIIRIDSPGGSSVGGEQLFNDIRYLSSKKPTVAVLRNMATSAAYMAAIASDYIVASHGTITGSVGAMVQSLEVSELAKKLGVRPITVTTGGLKGRPSPFEAFEGKDEKMLQELLSEYLEYFMGIVKDRRNLTNDSIAFISDGRIVSAKSAKRLGLIDEIGNEREARKWLNENHQLAPSMKIKTVEPDKEDDNVLDFLTKSAQNYLSESLSRQSGLISYPPHFYKLQ